MATSWSLARLAVDFDEEGGWRAFSSSELHGRRLCEEENGFRGG